jgi:TDG/mug DNA glycosylase family protein
MMPGLPDLMGTGLDVLFCGINPGMAAAASGLHFEGHSNRFWRVMHLSGFTPDALRPVDAERLLGYGLGLTTVVERPTPGAGDLSKRDFAAAGAAFERKVTTYAPRYVAFLGKAAYVALSGQRHVEWGLQSSPLGTSRVWLLPNPSGRNRAFSLEQLAQAYRDLRLAVAETKTADPKGRPSS